MNEVKYTNTVLQVFQFINSINSKKQQIKTTDGMQQIISFAQHIMTVFVAAKHKFYVDLSKLMFYYTLHLNK